jgi:hypothetical protein
MRFLDGLQEWLADRVRWVQYPRLRSQHRLIWENDMPWERRLYIGTRHFFRLGSGNPYPAVLRHALLRMAVYFVALISMS